MRAVLLAAMLAACGSPSSDQPHDCFDFAALKVPACALPLEVAIDPQPAPEPYKGCSGTQWNTRSFECTCPDNQPCYLLVDMQPCCY